jgi:hypothetical protein
MSLIGAPVMKIPGVLSATFVAGPACREGEKVSPPFEGGVAGKLIICSLQDPSHGRGG